MTETNMHTTPAPLRSRAMRALGEFFRLEAAGGIMLIGAAVLALVFANSPLNEAYDAFRDMPVQVRVGALDIAKPALLWINDGLMAVFFFLIGLEIKREVMEGELSRCGQVVLPAVAAVGGMAVPALLFSGFTRGYGDALAGWAIPSATDIAFALGILSLFGRRVPVALKVFLLSVAILDDLLAIVVIAIFYTSKLSALSMMLAGCAMAILLAMKHFRVVRLFPYLVVGLFMWSFVLKSGVHATLAGVLLALCIPLDVKDQPSPARMLEHELHPWVTLFIVPLFAFANAGVPLGSVGFSTLLAPVTLGVALGLFLGKQAGIFLSVALVIRLGIARLPTGTTWAQLYGVALLCGIGFTMSLFITSLAWPPGSPYIDQARLGILIGTLASASGGSRVLVRALPPR
ncbi:MAG TPA: Na+/H+ antiporter NhaA, partial [Immundisolibacter sp.]